MSIAVVLHVGALPPLIEILRDIGNLRTANVRHDLFVNLVEGKVDKGVATALITQQFPTARIITSENRGMDIGGFFQVLPLIFRGDSSGTPYTYILKLHTKSMKAWRRALINPICGTPQHIQRAMHTFNTFPKVGMIGANNHTYKEPMMRKPNFYYIQQITAKLDLSYTSFRFVGGTMFYVRMSIIEKVFKNVDLVKLLSEMNTPKTLDPYWYILNYPDKGVKSVTDAEKHFKDHGEKAGRFRNCLDAREKGATRYLPDGMVEHAYERIFGLIVEHSGYTLHGAY
jgi:lipopolysaccharide biosynthesis protein